MQQLDIFSFDNESIENKKAPAPAEKESKKIIDIKTKDYQFNFDFAISKIKALTKTYKKSFSDVLEIGKHLYNIKYYKPYIKDKHDFRVTFWEYIEDKINLDFNFAYEHIRSFEIFELLKEKDFLILPTAITHIKDIYNYSDNQIIEIWQILNTKFEKVTSKVIKEIKEQIRLKKRLEYISNTNTFSSYNEFLGLYYKKQFYDLKMKNQFNYSNRLSYNLNDSYNDLMEKYNLLVRSSNENNNFKIQFENLSSQSRLKDIEITLLKIENTELKNNKSSYSSYNFTNNSDVYLKVLNLKQGYSQKELKESYKKLSKIYHPDINRNENDNRKISFENTFKLINEAYENLKR